MGKHVSSVSVRDIVDTVRDFLSDEGTRHVKLHDEGVVIDVWERGDGQRQIIVTFEVERSLISPVEQGET